MIVIESASAASRLTAARAFLDRLPRDAEVLIVGASRGATFGLYRFSLTQLAARFAAAALASERLSPTTALGVQAVAARALFEATDDRSLTYFEPVATTPGFPRALARTLEELALANIPGAALRQSADGGPDVANLLERFDEQFDAACAVDRARFFRTATRAAAEGGPYGGCRLLLLDVPVMNVTGRAFVAALVARAPEAFATLPKEDRATRDALATFGSIASIDPEEGAGLWPGGTRGASPIMYIG